MQGLAETFRKDGVVHIAGALDAQALSLVEAAFDWRMANPGPAAGDFYAESSANLSEGAQSQAASVEQMTASVEQMIGSIEVISKNAADSKAQAVKEIGPYYRYLHNTLVGIDQPGFGTLSNSGYSGAAIRPFTPPPAGQKGGRGPVFGITQEQLAERADEFPWGTPDEVAEHIIRQAEVTGAGMRSRVSIAVNHPCASSSGLSRRPEFRAPHNSNPGGRDKARPRHAPK